MTEEAPQFRSRIRKPASVCPYCHGDIGEEEECYVCPACDTPYHRDCRAESGCYTLGCPGEDNNVITMPEKRDTHWWHNWDPPWFRWPRLLRAWITDENRFWRYYPRTFDEWVAQPDHWWNRLLNGFIHWWETFPFPWREDPHNDDEDKGGKK